LDYVGTEDGSSKFFQNFRELTVSVVSYFRRIKSIKTCYFVALGKIPLATSPQIARKPKLSN